MEVYICLMMSLRMCQRLTLCYNEDNLSHLSKGGLC